MTGDTHYDVETLAELAEGLLDDTTALRVREHLAICDACGETLADLAAVREVLAAVPVPAMPLGVAKRIDRALAAEAPDWDRVMRDAPWETASAPAWADALQDVHADATPAAAEEPAVVPAQRRERQVVDPLARRTVVAAGQDAGNGAPARRGRSSRRRLWAVPAAAAAATAVILGGAGLVTNLLADGTPTGQYALGTGDTSESPAGTPQAASYSIFASGHNYTSRELRGPLLGYFGVAPGSGTNDDEDLDTCVKRFSNQLDRTPIGVDKALYNGNEATVMAFWEDQKINAVRVVVVDSECHPLRPDGLATWK
ncbi:anti-sigma factor family protein [Microbispora sp. ATCC PTA-5024]|uniref:anti-sigma factor family protein n=1 Tax=Microbispora sp. ATCC PTA-5024 TaxID=316330 RepID=UPI0003DCEA04|nr:zf-HC2 domain-containing protein [Microbispora sp. ATCC PTA-5024]ETK35036.1 hypothetical protein MPTA5024_16230 [Microbispora sp. ATCC PTA-5024]